MSTFREFSNQASALALEVSKHHASAPPILREKIERAVDALLKAKAYLTRARVLAGEPGAMEDEVKCG